MYWTGKSNACFNKQTKSTTKTFTQVLVFHMKVFTLNEIEKLVKCPLRTAAVKEDRNTFSSDVREGFAL